MGEVVRETNGKLFTSGEGVMEDKSNNKLVQDLSFESFFPKTETVWSLGMGSKYEGSDALSIAISSGELVKVTTTLQQRGVELTPHHLFLAIDQDRTEIVKKLLDVKPNSRLNKSCEGQYPLHFAVLQGNPDIVEALLKQKTFCRSLKSWTLAKPVLEAALEGKNPRIIQALGFMVNNWMPERSFHIENAQKKVEEKEKILRSFAKWFIDNNEHVMLEKLLPHIVFKQQINLYSYAQTGKKPINREEKKVKDVKEAKEKRKMIVDVLKTHLEKYKEDIEIPIQKSDQNNSEPQKITIYRNYFGNGNDVDDKKTQSEAKPGIPSATQPPKPRQRSFHKQHPEVTKTFLQVDQEEMHAGNKATDENTQSFWAQQRKSLTLQTKEAPSSTSTPKNQSRCTIL